MANFKIIFNGTERSEHSTTNLECYVNTFDEIFITIEMEDYPPSFICLDKSTSIKLAKTLRTEINKIKD